MKVTKQEYDEIHRISMKVFKCAQLTQAPALLLETLSDIGNFIQFVLSKMEIDPDTLPIPQVARKYWSCQDCRSLDEPCSKEHREGTVK